MTAFFSPLPEKSFASPFAESATFGEDDGAIAHERDDFSANSVSDVPDELHEAHERITHRILEVLQEPVAQGSETLQPADTVVGVGFGADRLGRADVLNVYTEAERDETRVRAVLASEFGIAAARSRNFRIEVIPNTAFESNANSGSFMPAPGGVSVGLAAAHTGTIGLLAVGRRPPRDSRLLLLSCNHVLANCNAAAAGDPAVQPGTQDGGVSPSNDIGKLERFVTLDWARANFVDAATAWVDPTMVVKEIVWTGGTVTLDTTVIPGAMAMRVAKAGRSSERTDGNIVDLAFSGRIRMPNRTHALFSDQIVVRGTMGPFSFPGDSGAVVWRAPQSHVNGQVVSPIGMVIAGSRSGLSVVSKLGYALSLLDVEIF